MLKGRKGDGMAALVGSEGAVVWMVAVLLVLAGGLTVALLAATRFTRRL